jgi:hypothetical protein
MDYNAGAGLTESVTACQTALATLKQLGRSADADELLTEAASSSSYDAIAADTTRNDEWKLQKCALAYTNVMSTLARQLTAAAELASTKYKIDAETVFGTRGLPGDPATLTVSRRDAGERIADENDSIKLQRLLDDAILNGDNVFARAIAQKAVTNRDADTVTAFQAAYPDLANATERLWNTATHGTTTVDVAMGWRLGALKPAPLQPLMDYEIAAAAAGQTNAGALNVG